MSAARTQPALAQVRWGYRMMRGKCHGLLPITKEPSPLISTAKVKSRFSGSFLAELSSALPPQVEHGSDKNSHLVEPDQIPFQQETHSACGTSEQILPEINYFK